MLDPAPRVVLDPELGMCALGRTAKDAGIVADIYDHTMDVIERAALLGGYRALPARDIFDVEYWDLEQAKLRKSGKPPAFAGEVALVTGAASGIGKACVEALLARGAAVIGLDLNPENHRRCYERADFLGLHCDVTVEGDVIGALEAAVRAFGGLDMLMLNAGVFPGGTKIATLATAEWRKVMQVNLDANLASDARVPPAAQARAARRPRRRHRLEERARARARRGRLFGLEGRARPAGARRRARVGRGRHPRQRAASQRRVRHRRRGARTCSRRAPRTTA